MTFVDVAVAAGVDATAQDTSGVCFGDIDNDGDEDLYVLGTGELHRLLENNGDGTFTDITGGAGAGGAGPSQRRLLLRRRQQRRLLDIVIANTYGGCSNPINPKTGLPSPAPGTATANQPAQSGWDHRLPVFGALATRTRSWSRTRCW